MENSIKKWNSKIQNLNSNGFPSTYPASESFIIGVSCYFLLNKRDWAICIPIKNNTFKTKDPQKPGDYDKSDLRDLFYRAQLVPNAL